MRGSPLMPGNGACTPVQQNMNTPLCFLFLDGNTLCLTNFKGRKGTVFWRK